MAPSIDLDKETDKLYYSIGEVAEMFSVNTSLIRFWEKEFDILKPKKNKKGNRLFTPDDLQNIKLIFHLVKERGYTLDGARKILDQKKKDLEKEMELRKSLLSLKNFLTELKEQL